MMNGNHTFHSIENHRKTCRSWLSQSRYGLKKEKIIVPVPTLSREGGKRKYALANLLLLFRQPGEIFAVTTLDDLYDALCQYGVLLAALQFPKQMTKIDNQVISMQDFEKYRDDKGKLDTNGHCFIVVGYDKNKKLISCINPMESCRQFYISTEDTLCKHMLDIQLYGVDLQPKMITIKLDVEYEGAVMRYSGLGEKDIEDEKKEEQTNQSWFGGCLDALPYDDDFYASNASSPMYKGFGEETFGGCLDAVPFDNMVLED